MKRLLWLVILFSLCVAFSACGPKDERLSKQAKELYTAKKYDEAINKYLEVLQVNENYVQAYFNLAVIYTKVDPPNYESAAMYIKKTVEKATETGIPADKIDKYKKLSNKIIKSYYEEVVSKEDTLEAYEKFIAENADYPGIADITAKIHEKKFEEVKKVGTVEAYEEYVTKNPDSKFIYNAQSEIYNKLIEQNDESVMKEYLKAHPDFKFKKEISDKLSESAYGKILDVKPATKKIKLLKEFIEEYPESKFASKAKEDIVGAEWERVSSEGTIEAFKGFAEEFKDSDKTKEALENVDKLLFKKLKTDAAITEDLVEQVKVYKKFIEDNPNSMFADKVKGMIATLEKRIEQDKKAAEGGGAEGGDSAGTPTEEPAKEEATEPAKEEPATEPAKEEPAAEPAKEEPAKEEVKEPAKEESKEPAKEEEQPGDLFIP